VMYSIDETVQWRILSTEETMKCFSGYVKAKCGRNPQRRMSWSIVVVYEILPSTSSVLEERRRSRKEMPKKALGEHSMINKV